MLSILTRLRLGDGRRVGMLSGRRNLPGLPPPYWVEFVLPGAGLDAVLGTGRRCRHSSTRPICDQPCRDRTGLRMSLVILAGSGLDAVLRYRSPVSLLSNQTEYALSGSISIFSGLGRGAGAVRAVIGLDASPPCRSARYVYRAIVPGVNRLERHIGILYRWRSDLRRGACRVTRSFRWRMFGNCLGVRARIPNGDSVQCTRCSPMNFHPDFSTLFRKNKLFQSNAISKRTAFNRRHSVSVC